jgi:hypothetical protein
VAQTPRPPRRRDLLDPERLAARARAQGPLGPDALAAELRRLHYRRSPWDEWLDAYRAGPDAAGEGADDPGDGGAATWERDHPPRTPAA